MVVSAGSSVGARDETAAAIASLGEPGIWCHGLALRPGKPTLLADCGGVPVIGLPGNPRSALVVFRLVGMPIVRLVGGVHRPAARADGRRPARARPPLRGRAARRRPGAAAGRRAEPLFGSSSLLSILTAADGYVVVPESATGLGGGQRGRGHAVPVDGSVATPLHPRSSRRRGVRRLGGGVQAAGCPERLEAVRLPLDEAVGRVTAEPVWATRASSPPFDAAAMDGIAVHASDTSAPARRPRSARRRDLEVVDTGDPIPGDFDAVVMREEVHEVDGGVERARRRRALPARPLDRRGRERGGAAAAAGHRLRPVDVAAAGAAGATDLVRRRPAVTVIPDRRRDPAGGTELGPGELDTNSVMLAAQAEAAGCEAHRFEVAPDVPDEIAAAVRAAAARSDLVIVIAGSSAGRDDHTAPRSWRGRHAGGARSGGARATRWCSAWSRGRRLGGEGVRHPGAGRARLPGLRGAHLRHLRRARAGRARGRRAAERRRSRRRDSPRKLASTMGMDDWVRVRLGRVGGALVATPLPRGAGVLTSLVRADGLLVVPAEPRGHHAGEEVDGPPAAPRGRDRPHDRGHGLARPRARPGGLQVARARPGRDARLVERARSAA